MELMKKFTSYTCSPITFLFIKIKFNKRGLYQKPGHPVEGGRPLVIKGAYHEILFEKDAMRSVALHAIVDFFNRHNSPSGNRSTEV